MKINYPLPLILNIIENIGTKKMFIKMDLRQEYNNMRIKEGNKWKAVFTTPEELFKLIVMFLGLTNSLATFQTIMNELLRDLINIEKVESFIDDIVVEMESEEEHDELVKEILRRLEENDLYVKLEKYRQKVRKVDFLGVVIGLEGIKIKKEKVKTVLDWLFYKSVKDVQKFLELANYYRRFVEEFAKIVRPLHDLTRKEQKQKWEIRQKKLLEALKKRFIIELILVVLNLDRRMRIEVDAPDYAIREVLLMKCNNGQQRPVVYLSKLLNETERNYEIYDKEILAVIRG